MTLIHDTTSGNGPAPDSDELVGEKVLPLYLVGDESPSMDGKPIAALNQTLPELHRAVALEPVISEKIRFGIITFAGTAEVTLGLSDLATLTDLPGFACRDGGTNYAAAFAALESEVGGDISRLKAAGHRVLRPAVFFLSDGMPNGPDWHPAYSSLRSQAWAPNIIAFGFGQADAATIQQVGTVGAFIADQDMSPAQALAEFAKALVRSVVASASAIAAGTGNLMVAAPAGFTALPVSTV